MTSSDLVALVARLQDARDDYSHDLGLSHLFGDAKAAIEQLQAELNDVHEATGVFGVDKPMSLLESVQALRAELEACKEDVSELRALDNEAQHGADALAAELAAVKRKIDELFPVIAHGDDKHRAWLKDAIEKHFDAFRAQGEK